MQNKPKKKKVLALDKIWTNVSFNWKKDSTNTLFKQNISQKYFFKVLNDKII